MAPRKEKKEVEKDALRSKVDQARAIGKERNAGLKAGVKKRRVAEAKAQLTAPQAAYEKESRPDIKEQLDAIREQIDQDEMNIDTDDADPAEGNLRIKSEDTEDGLFVPQSPAGEAASTRPRPGDGSVGGLADGQPTAVASSQETDEEPAAGPPSPGDSRTPPLFVVDAGENLPPRATYPDEEDVLSSRDMEKSLEGRGAKQIILQYGPPNAARYCAVASGLVNMHIEKKDGKYRVRSKAEIFFQGVAWAYPDDHETPIQLLIPANWPLNAKTGWPKTPFTIIWVRIGDWGHKELGDQVYRAAHTRECEDEPGQRPYMGGPRHRA
ncbi:hypothetical protein F4779DRAFT_621053 [Xylariaceae sp. FL0662B]|nr:hypothetical protein F4779DRAFT_621053 [Xylariaceae sp. FL0662B]